MLIGLIGDYDETVTAHQAIPLSIDLAADALSASVRVEWIPSDAIAQQDLSRLAAMWCIPASPYRDMESVLCAIAYARDNNLPFLGTCGGYQHAALEFARNELGLGDADNAEVNPDAAMPLISALACRLVDVSDEIRLRPNSRIARIYGRERIHEAYHCSFGVNRDYLDRFNGSDMVFTGFDADGDPRVLEVPSKRFYIGTAFQPERHGLRRQVHPLVQAFVEAALQA